MSDGPKSQQFSEMPNRDLVGNGKVMPIYADPLLKRQEYLAFQFFPYSLRNFISPSAFILSSFNIFHYTIVEITFK